MNKCEVINKTEWVTKTVGVVGSDLTIESGEYVEVACGGEMEEIGGKLVLDSNYGGVKIYQCKSCKTIQII